MNTANEHQDKPWIWTDTVMALVVGSAIALVIGLILKTIGLSGGGAAAIVLLAAAAITGFLFKDPPIFRLDYSRDRPDSTRSDDESV